MLSSPTRRDRLWFWGTCAAMWGFFVLICHWSPILLDDWYQVIYWQRHPFSLGALWDNGVYNYFHYNPRLGENFLLLVHGPKIIYWLLTPTVEMLLVWVMFALTFARWPRPTRADAGRVFVLLIVLWMVAPVPGIMWFYRPFNTNYVYGITLTLLLFVPYRLALARGAAASVGRWWWAPLLFIAGLAAGLTNEHTGPTAMLALAILVFVLWKTQRKLRPWMIAGLVGLFIGYPMLYFAPGQSERYGGIATKLGPIDVIKERGASGTLDVLRGFIWEGQLAIYILVGATLLARRRRAPQPPATIDLAQGRTMAAMIVAAILIVMTLFASPTWGERLFFAPAVLFAMALMIYVDVLARERAARKLIVITCAITAAYHGVRLVQIYPKAYAENQQRIEIIQATPPGGIAYIPPYSNARSPWMNADDFGYASLREEVAHMFGNIGGIEFDRPLRMEPTPPYTLELAYEFDPPLAKAEVERQVTFPLNFVPSYVDRNVQLVRRTVPQLKAIPGHRLKSVTSYVRGLDLPILHGRPLVGMRWHDDKFDLVDVRRYFDDQGMLYWLTWGNTLPPGTNESYLVSCGETKALPLTVDPDGQGYRMTFGYTCRGIYMMIVCNQAECWLATTAFR